MNDLETHGNITTLHRERQGIITMIYKDFKRTSTAPREIYNALTNVKGLEKEKSKLRHILGIEHGNIPIQLDLWGNEVIFRGKGQTTIYGYPRPEACV
jgi:hypothetical protein